MSKCPGCDVPKTPANTYPSKRRDKLDTYCANCRRKRSRERARAAYRANPAKYLERNRRRRMVRAMRKVGL